MVLHTCKCGFEFDHVPEVKKLEFESFALIRDQDFAKFLEAESKLVETRAPEALNEAAQYVTTLYQCPKCQRIHYYDFSEKDVPKARVFREEE